MSQNTTCVGPRPVAYLVPLARSNIAHELIRGAVVSRVLVLSPFQLRAAASSDPDERGEAWFRSEFGTAVFDRADGARAPPRIGAA